MTKIAIIGTQGMLGSAVCRYLSEKNYQILEINKSGKTQNSNPVTEYDIAKNNIDELKAYINKLEVLSDTIIKHYGDKKLEK